MNKKLLTTIATTSIIALSAFSAVAAQVEKNDSRLPPGIRHAPGIEKRIENGKGLPNGLMKFLNGFPWGSHHQKGSSTHPTSTPPATTTPDVTAPKILSNLVHAVSSSSASFFVLTNEKADAKIWLGTTTPVNTSVSATASSSAFVSFHDLNVTGLASSTLYYYVLGVSDHIGNMATTSGSFTTK